METKNDTPMALDVREFCQNCWPEVAPFTVIPSTYPSCKDQAHNLITPIIAVKWPLDVATLEPQPEPDSTDIEAAFLALKVGDLQEKWIKVRPPPKQADVKSRYCACATVTKGKGSCKNGDSCPRAHTVPPTVEIRYWNFVQPLVRAADVSLSTLGEGDFVVCTICQIKMNSAIQLSQHEAGSRHITQANALSKKTFDSFEGGENIAGKYNGSFKASLNPQEGGPLEGQDFPLSADEASHFFNFNYVFEPEFISVSSSEVPDSPQILSPHNGGPWRLNSKTQQDPLSFPNVADVDTAGGGPEHMLRNMYPAGSDIRGSRLQGYRFPPPIQHPSNLYQQHLLATPASPNAGAHPDTPSLLPNVPKPGLLTPADFYSPTEPKMSAGSGLRGTPILPSWPSDQGAGDRNTGVSQLFSAVRAGNHVLVASLLKQGADVNSTCGGCSMLHWAVYFRHPNVLMELMECNPHVNAQSKEGHSLLHIAVHPVHGDDQGNTIMMFGSRFINANLQDNEGRTALHHAVSQGKVNAVRTLLHIGAHTEVTCRQGFNPMDVAYFHSQYGSRAHVYCLDLLRESLYHRQNYGSSPYPGPYPDSRFSRGGFAHNSYEQDSFVSARRGLLPQGQRGPMPVVQNVPVASRQKKKTNS